MDGEELLELDYLANIFRVGGIDQLTDYRINIIGGSHIQGPQGSFSSFFPL